MARLYFLTFLLLSALPLLAQQSLNICKLRLADQSDFVNNRGFLLYLEAIESNASVPCRISNMKLILAVGDGSQFRYIINNTSWQQDRDYTVRAEVRNGQSQIFLDNTPLESQATSFVAASGPVGMNRVVNSEAGRTELFWYNSQTTLTSGTSTANLFMPQFPLQLFERLRDTRGSFTADASQGVTITARFRLAAAAEPQLFAPFVDKYGQSVHANYAKIVADSDFATRNTDEQTRIANWLPQVNVDSYGAPLTPPWTDSPTGFYRIKKVNNFWWLLTPEGKPVFYIGLNALPAIYDPLASSTITTGREWLFAEQPPSAFRDGVAGRSFFYNWNLSRKYGSTWEVATWNRTMDRFRAWGFSGAGKWKSAVPTAIAPNVTRQGVTPEIPVLPIWNFGPNVVTAPGIDGNPLALPDVFDVGVRSQLEVFVNNQMGSRKSDPYIVGWSMGNETHGIVMPQHVRNLLASPTQTSAKIALIDYAIDTIYGGNITTLARAWQVTVTTRIQLYAGFLSNLPPADVENMRGYFERQLLKTYYDTVKRVDPGHLYFGFWIVPGWWVTSDDWRNLAEFTDVVGYDHYTAVHNPTLYRDLNGVLDKPIFNGEFSFPPNYGGQRGFNTAFPAAPGVASFDEAEAASRYTAFLQAARQDPNCIGVGYFAYIDQMITGRSVGDPFGTARPPIVQGENFAFGLVDVSDTPKQGLVDAVRSANRDAVSTRLTLTGPVSATTFALRVTVSGSGSVTGSVPCTNQCTQSFASGTVVTLNAVPGAGQTFVGWSGACIGAGTCTLTVTSDLNVSAVFAPGNGGGVITGALLFVPVSPCRMVDTRNAAGALAGPVLGAGQSRSFPLLSSACSLPSNTAAYSANITVVPRGLLGYISVWPTGQTQPVVSTLNSLDGRIKANAAIVPAGTNGAISVFATHDTDIVIDVNGVFVPTGTSTAAQSFYPVTPCRIADTRTAPGTFGQPALTALGTRTYPVISAGCGVPSTATAYSLNVTVVPGRPLGFLTLWPAGQLQPVVSTLNALTGTIVANAAIVPAGTGGAINVFSTDSTEFIMDINGYFAPPGGLNALSFFAVNPCRVLDTRNANGALGGPVQEGITAREYPVPSSACGIPTGARAYSLNATVLPATTLGYLTLWPTGITQPLVSTLNAIDGSLTSNAAVVPAGLNGSITAFVTDRTHILLDINGYFAP
jgi:hypothetical protein